MIFLHNSMMIAIDHGVALQKAACIYNSKVPDDEPQRKRRCLRIIVVIKFSNYLLIKLLKLSNFVTCRGKDYSYQLL